LLFNGRPAIENLPLCMKDAISGAQWNFKH
jgi:hypothetical protein